MIYRSLGPALLALAFTACVSPPTPYIPAEAGPPLPGVGQKPEIVAEDLYGYSEIEISPTIVRVTFSGNSSTEDTRALDFALLRAAEVTLKRGYPFFLVRDRVNASTSRTYTSTSPGIPTTSCDKEGHCFTTYGASTTITNTVRWPVRTNLVEFFAEAPPDGSTLFVLEARFVQRVLREKYDLFAPGARTTRGVNE
jgi:hypothetical protein